MYISCWQLAPLLDQLSLRVQEQEEHEPGKGEVHLCQHLE